MPCESLGLDLPFEEDEVENISPGLKVTNKNQDSLDLI